jgi:transposase
MAIADASGFPIAIDTQSASPHEVTLVSQTIETRFFEALPDKLIGDKAYDSDTLDERLHQDYGVEMIAPHRSNRTKPKTQDGRKLRRYRKRWRIERLFAWIHNFRRCIVRHEYYQINFEGFLKLACIIILLRQF